MLNHLLKYILLLPFLVILAVPLVGNAEGDGRPDAVENARNSIVKIHIESFDKKNRISFGHGSGFVIAPNKVITNAHVASPELFFPDVKTSSVSIIDGGVSGGKLKKVNDIEILADRDLAILTVDSLSERPALPVALPVDGQVIYSMGFPGVGEIWDVNKILEEESAGKMTKEKLAAVEKQMSTPSVKDGRISRMVEDPNWSVELDLPSSITPVKVIQHSADIEKGNSGGPIINNCGAVVGVNSQSANTNYSAVDAAELMAFLTVKNVAFQKQEACSGQAGATTDATPSATDEGIPMWWLVGGGLVLAALVGFGILLFSQPRSASSRSAHKAPPPKPSVSNKLISSTAPVESGYCLQGLQGLGHLRFPLTGSHVQLGYDEELNDCAIPERTVSRQHASLHHKDGQWQLIPLRTLNPTTLNNEVLEPNDIRTLTEGDVLALGEASFVFSKG
ncbi:FHA domain-containing protein [Thiothrix caldifontis]|uniref:FHA domain-containing protein n=1 Tax=Thiothrix caldifontis TaxID=525918 RepID=A0A1H4G533_9GAMM|nr:trypsin-like peptidase domain-containing protein [Thiothrix caldifontis]SEB04709.1 FHA domain-containing protein [Thiothrix caldifontis]